MTQLNHVYVIKPPQKGQKDKVPRVLGLVDTWRFGEGSTPRESMKLHTLSPHSLHCPSLLAGWSLNCFLKSYLFLAVLGSLLLLGGFLWLQWAGSTLCLQGMGFSLWWFLSLQSTGSRHAGANSCCTWAQRSRLSGSRAQAQSWWCTGLAAS